MLEPSLSMRVCAAAAFDVAYAASAGTLLNRLWLGGCITSASAARLRHWLNGCSVLMLVTIPIQLVLLAASMTGNLSWKLVWSSMPDVVTTHAGHALTLSFCLVPFLLLSSVFSPAFSRRVGAWTGIVLVLGITVCRAAFGHAASDGDFTLRELVQFLHLSSIATWGGGVAIAGLLVVPHLAATAQSEEVIRFGRRLSRTVTIALIVVVLSGIFSAWKGLGGSLAPLPHTAWGRMLTMKVCIVLLTFLHGGRVRLLLDRKRSLSPSGVASIRRWLRLEAFLIICVLIVSAWLANLPPPDM